MMVDNTTAHKPVLQSEILDFFSKERKGESLGFLFMLDGTLGGGGHSEAFLRRFDNSLLIGIDRDPEAVERSKRRLRPFGRRALCQMGNFGSIKDVLDAVPEELCDFVSDKRNSSDLRFDCILLDLGLSSDQLADPSRGFSFQNEGELDMRMSPDSEIRADDIVNNYSFSDLKGVLLRGGVGQSSDLVARHIVRNRPIRSTRHLATVCSHAVSKQRDRDSSGQRSHPATVPFQAIRMAVNDEIGALRSFLSVIPEILAPGGRLAVICFHSLEDKIVTEQMREWSRDTQAPRKLPWFGQSDAFGKLLTKKAARATAGEIEENVRSRSARMRVFERRK